MNKNAVYIQRHDSNVAYRVNFADLLNLEINYQLNSNYEISLTLTYVNSYKGAFNAAQDKATIFFNGELYDIQQTDTTIDNKGLLQLKVTANHALVDKMKNCRVDKTYPTEDNPESSGGSDTSSSTNNDQNKQPGVTTKKTGEKQTYSLQDRLDKFFNGNDQGIKYELHGNFPNVAVDVQDTSLYEWLNQHLKEFSAYYIPVGNVVKIYDLQSLQHETGRQFRYQHNMTNANVQTDVNEIVNDCEVYGGKMEKDITTGGVSNGVNEPVNGDWTPVIKNAAAIIGEKLSDSDINLIKAQINLESSGREDVIGGTDGLSDGAAKGLLQFKQGTFNYYCRPPYNNIMKGLDQLIALMNIPGWRNQITGRHGWSPHGAPISKEELKPQMAGAANQIAEFCKQFVGKVPYVWGGNTPNGWDCSGFVAYVYNHFGIPMHQPTTYEEYQGQVVGPPYQTGDMLFWGARGSTYHTSIAINSEWRVGADNERDGTVMMQINRWPPAFGVRNAKMAALAGGDATLGDGQTSTTTQTYYALHFHFEDADSIKRYGRHRGKPLAVDSIYDMDALKKYADVNIQHKPKTTFTVKDIFEKGFSIGDVWHVIVPEMNLKVAVTLLGIKYKPFNPDNSSATLSFNNSGIVMQSVLNAIYEDIKGINSRPDQFNAISATSSRSEDHFGQIVTLNADQVKAINQWMEGGDNNE